MQFPVMACGVVKKFWVFIGKMSWRINYLNNKDNRKVQNNHNTVKNSVF